MYPPYRISILSCYSSFACHVVTSERSGFSIADIGVAAAWPETDIHEFVSLRVQLYSAPMLHAVIDRTLLTMLGCTIGLRNSQYLKYPFLIVIKRAGLLCSSPPSLRTTTSESTRPFKGSQQNFICITLSLILLSKNNSNNVYMVYNNLRLRPQVSASSVHLPSKGRQAQ